MTMRTAFSNRDNRLYLTGEAVRSLFHGPGRVITSGYNPTVQFLTGSRHRVNGESLKPIPDEQFDTEIANQEAIERYLDLIMYGRIKKRPRCLPHRFDLTAALRSDLPPDLGHDVSPLDDARLLFISHDLNGDPGGDTTDDTFDRRLFQRVKGL
ncbi:MAG: hypothetical protein ACE5EQ_12485 [Phycisphaerae bacterium]